MLDVGVIRADERVELLGGELIEMVPQGPLHWRYAQALVEWLTDNRPPNASVASNGPLRLSEHEEPELFMYPKGMDVNEVRGPHTLLVVEVALSSLGRDLAVKAPIYAAHGVRECWIVDVQNPATLVHTLGETGYGEPRSVGFAQPLIAPGGAALVTADLVSGD